MENKPIINVKRISRSETEEKNNKENLIKKKKIIKKYVSIIEPEQEPEPEEPEIIFKSENEDEFPESFDSEFFSELNASIYTKEQKEQIYKKLI